MHCKYAYIYIHSLINKIDISRLKTCNENIIHKCWFIERYCVNKHIHDENIFNKCKFCINSNDNDKHMI